MHSGLWSCCCATSSGMTTITQCLDCFLHMLPVYAACTHSKPTAMAYALWSCCGCHWLSSNGSAKAVTGVPLTRQLHCISSLSACCTICGQVGSIKLLPRCWLGNNMKVG